MSKKYDLCLRGETYHGISLAEARKILSKVYSYPYIEELVNKANADSPSVEIELTAERIKPWLLDGVRMDGKTALFHLGWKGCNAEESECLLRANKLCAETEDTIKAIRETCQRIDEVLQCWQSKS